MSELFHFSQSTSPFAILWLLFLIFFGIVVVVNIVSFIAAWYIDWRMRSLLKKYGSKPNGERS